MAVTRGWTRLDQTPDVLLDGFPAHAGMDRYTVERRAFPRPRAVRLMGFPAHAGMDRRPCRSAASCSGHSTVYHFL